MLSNIANVFLVDTVLFYRNGSNTESVQAFEVLKAFNSDLLIFISIHIKLAYKDSGVFIQALLFWVSRPET